MTLHAPGTEPLVQVKDLSVEFRKKKLLSPERVVRAVNGVSFEIGRGETLGLVGESGSGKSTTGRALLKLVPVTSGSVRVDAHELTTASASEMRRLRRQMQMVFQDPYSSLDPSATVASSIAEPLRVHEGISAKDAWPRILELLEIVGLRPSHANRYPYEFSGGQRQRVAIARALALNPQLIVCDEAVSALDVSTQNQVINLLEDLRDELGLSYLFIAHDLAIVRHISHRVAVMYLGHIVESGPAERIYERPAHPYSQALLSAIPVPSRQREAKSDRILLQGDLPDPANPPPGCPFQTRCPYAMDVCREQMPPMTEVDGGGEVACHLQSTGPTLNGASLADAGQSLAHGKQEVAR
jgi:oligopeptide/dipeptide ABC transporter ATP-binding protein